MILEQVVYIIFWLYLVLMFGFIVIGITKCLKALNISKRKISIITVIILCVFMAIANFTASVVRACIMTNLILMSRLFL